MNNFDLSQFHFIRPLWLWGCLPALLLCYLLWRQKGQAGRWQRAIDMTLLPHLLDNATGGSKRWPLFPLLMAWLLACFAIAGPVWEKLPQPVRQKVDALVIIQDLSLSLYAQDLAPNRLTRALHKLGDILHSRKEGTTGLVVYSGDAYVVAPLTDDTRTIDGMLSALSPEIMPSYGSNSVAAVKKALQLLKDTAVRQGRLLLISDEISATDLEEITDLIGHSKHTLSVLGVGTAAGGPIPKEDGGFFKDNDGKIIVPKMNRPLLQELAARNHGRYSDIQLTDQDINYLLAATPILPREENYRQVKREFDQWREQGGWLVLLILPLALLSFRRGWLISLILLLSLWNTDSQAMNWHDLWQRPDQQAAAAMAQNNPKKAAALFKTTPWKGAAQYRAGDYKGAAQTLSKAESASAHYNLGNALAKAGNLQEAITAYEQALKINPEMADAQSNQQLVKKLLEEQQQKQDQKDQQDQDGKTKKDGKDQDKKQSSKKDQPQKGADEQNDKKSSAQKNEPNSAKDSDKKKQQSEPAAKQDPSKQNKDKKAGQDSTEQGKPDSPPKPLSPASNDDKSLTAEQQQALQQWLRQVPDNPGGLLKRKFEYEYSNNQGKQNKSQKGKIW